MKRALRPESLELLSEAPLPQGLRITISCIHIAGKFVADGINPAHKTGLEGNWVEFTEDTRKGIVGGNTS